MPAYRAPDQGEHGNQTGLAMGSQVLTQLLAASGGPYVGKAKISVLFLAYHFPPTGGAGVQRALKFARYLPSFGIDPIVLTRPAGPRDRWTPEDESLVAEIPPAVRVLTLPGPEPTAAPGWRRFLERNFFLESRWQRWWVEGAFELGGRVIREERPAAILATMAPYESAYVSSRLAAEYALPWIADLRDPWALDEMRIYPTSLHRRIDLGRMKSGLATAAAVIMNTPDAAAAFRAAFPNFGTRDVHVIPNGYDASDFVDGLSSAGSSFTIVHTGYLHASLGERHRQRGWLRWLGGELTETNILCRSHYFLLQAIQRWRDEAPHELGDVRLILAGPTSALDRKLVTDAGLDDVVCFAGSLPHRQSTLLLQSASVLFLPMHKAPPGWRARIVPGKTYEYLAARRPILAAVPDGDARDWLAESGIAWICRPDDVDAMKQALRVLYDRWRRAVPAPSPPAEFLARFERRRLTADLARLVHRVVSASTSGPIGKRA